MNKLRIGVFGAGALGSLLCAYLQPDHDVTLYTRRKYVSTLTHEGLKISGVLGEKTIKTRAVAKLNKEHFDLGVISVKLYDTTTILKYLDEQEVTFDMIASIQNGLKDDYLEERFGLENVLECIFNMGCETISPGHIYVTGVGVSYFGTQTKDKSNKKKIMIAQALSRSLRSKGLRAEVSEHMEILTWYKFMTAVTSMGISSSLGFDGAQNYLNPYALRLRMSVVKEVKEVAKNQGIPITEHPLLHRQYLWNLDDEKEINEIIESEIKKAEEKYLKKKAKPPVHSSLQDLRKGKPVTEADYILGSFIKKAEESRVPVPIIKTLYTIIKAKEYDNLIKE